MPFFDIFASPRWSPLRMRTKVVSFFIFFQELSNKKKIKALRPKMTKIASRGGGSCLNNVGQWSDCCGSTVHACTQEISLRNIKSSWAGKKGTALGAPIWLPSWPQRSRSSHQPEPSMAVVYQCRRRCSSAGSGYCRRFRQGLARRSATQTVRIWNRWHPSSLAHKLPVQPQPSSRCGRCDLPSLSCHCWRAQSILGPTSPTLFIVYVNDAPDVLPANTVPSQICRWYHAVLSHTIYWWRSSQVYRVSVRSRCTVRILMGFHLARKTWAIKVASHDYLPTSPSMPILSCEVWWCRCGRSELAETPWSDFRQNVEFWPTSAFSCGACSPANRLPAQSPVLSAVLDIPGRLTTYKGFVRPLMEYSPLGLLCGVGRLLAI